MQWLNFLIRNQEKNLCFLCLTQSKHILNVDELFEIHNRNFECTVSISEMTRELFTNFEMLLDKVCVDCTNLIIDIYILMKKNLLYKQVMSSAVASIDKQLDEHSLSASKRRSKTCRIQLKVPKNFVKLNRNPNMRENTPEGSDFSDRIDRTDMSEGIDRTDISERIDGTHFSEQIGRTDISERIDRRDFSERIDRTDISEGIDRTDISERIDGTHISERIDRTEISERIDRTDFSLRTDRKLKQNILKCNKCVMKFSNEAILQKHKTLAHQFDNQAVLCEICGKDFKNTDSLKLHLKEHDNKPCPHCGKVIKTKAYFQIHINEHTNPKQNKPVQRKYTYKCNECTFQSRTKQSLEGHMNRKHLKLRPYVCQICFKGFFRKVGLAVHGKVHDLLRTKTDICQVCGASFFDKKTLLDHIRLHNGEKPFECDKCGDKFVTRSRRYEHVKASIALTLAPLLK